MSLSNTARYSLWASVFCRRTVRGRESERTRLMRGGNEGKKDNKREHKKTECVGGYTGGKVH